MIEQIFVSAAGILGNMHGRQRQFSLGFIGLILYDIKMKLEVNGGLRMTISQEEIRRPEQRGTKRVFKTDTVGSPVLSRP